MLTAETKRHIDGARQVLVGVVPNPSSQIDQITNALIYKFMDDMDQSAIKSGGKPSFFTGDLEHYSWTRLMDTRLGNQERMNLYSEALVKFSEAKQLPELFRDIFKSAFLPYRSPEVLGLFLKEIDYFDYSHSEELGNAYEYLLSIMGSQGDAGQFRTPRHIIDFIVEVVNPSKDDKVLDPACGTAGFLVSAYNHILKQHDGKNSDGSKNNEKPLTPDQRKALMNNFEGYDVDPGMVRISRVNMYLHHFKNPKIYNYDTLTQDERWKDKFDVILANPPFMSPKGGVPRHNKFGIPSNRSEVLFVDYFIEHLRPKGRAGMIVPEGIIFQSATAHTALRKKLVEDGLYAVVSLPSGVFQPYSGVKTSILFFDNERASQNAEILFIKIENDGFDLGAQRRKHNKDNLPEALEILKKWKHGEKVESGLAIYVQRNVIAEKDDYNLSGDRYRIATDHTNSKWSMVELGEVVEILDSKRKPITKSDRKAGPFPYYGATGILDYVEDYIFDERLVLIGEDGAKWDAGENTAFIAEGKYWVNNHAHVVRPIKTRIIDSYLVSIFKYMDLTPYITGVTVPKLNQEKLRSIQFPLPPLEIQQQIVTMLDGYQNIISGARQVVENWHPKIDIDPEWDKVKLGDVCELIGGYAFKSSELKNERNNDSDKFVVKIGNVDKRGDLDVSDAQYFNYNDSLSKFLVFKDDILVAMTGATVGKVAVSQFDNLLLNQRVGLVRPEEDKISKHFLKYILLSDVFYNFCQNQAGGGAQGNISPSQIKNYEIPLPPLAIQKTIAEKIGAERALVESAKKLIEIYEQKMKDFLSKLWIDRNV